MRLVGVFVVAVATTVSYGAEKASLPKLSTRLQTALEANAKMFSNIHIIGKQTRRFLGPAEAVVTALQTPGIGAEQQEAFFTLGAHFELRFKGPLFRESIRNLIENVDPKYGLQDKLHEISFDGTKYSFGHKLFQDLASSSIFIYDPRTAAEYGESIDNPEGLAQMKFWYLDETGFIGPTKISSLGHRVESLVLSTADHRELIAVDSGDDRAGGMCEVILEYPEPWQSRETFEIEKHKEYATMTGGYDKYHMRMERERRQLAGNHRVLRLLLNSALGYAVEEKWESRKETGETMFHTKNSDFVKVDPYGAWMPKRCVIESHAYYTAPLYVSAEPLYETEIVLEKCEQGKFKNDEFRIWYDIPGASISDYTTPNATLEKPDKVRVPASVDKLPKGPAKSRQMLWLILLNIVFIAGWVGWWCLRLRKKATES